MAGKRKAYTPEFKLQAVKIITDQKLSVVKQLEPSSAATAVWIEGFGSSH